MYMRLFYNEYKAIYNESAIFIAVILYISFVFIVEILLYYCGFTWLYLLQGPSLGAERFLDPARSRNGDGPGFRFG